jgi:hypothetical protein
MLIVFRKSLVFILVMLQLFAPLVHAHSGSKDFNKGLHIPGLETFYINHDAAVVQKVNLDQDAEGLLVVVDAGIKNPHDTIAETEKVEFGFLPSSQILVSSLPFSDSNFSPQTLSFVFQKTHSTPRSRAPPAQ